MAWLEQTPTGLYHIGFRYGGEKHKKALHTRDRRVATARQHRVDENIRLVETGRLVVPDDADLCTFLLSDGRLNGSKTAKPKRKLRSLRQFIEAFLVSIPEGALEASTVSGMKTHLNHLRRVLGARFSLPEIDLGDLQAYVDKRSKEKGTKGKTLSPATIKKEITTLRTMWSWATDAGLIAGRLPLKGLRYPKGVDKPPFQTLADIQRRLSQHSPSESEQDDLWSALFLTTAEIDELLEHVAANARHPFVYPMFVFAAHTGSRRSEMLRSQLQDIDFAAGTVTIREKKRVRGRLTTRSVPLSPLLREVLRDWIPAHPGGQYTFAVTPYVPHSKNKSPAAKPLTRNQAHDYFQRALENSKWREARGWHLFRHSFCSNCAAAGIDQRIINAWVGHQTEEMVKRYRHLIPDQQQRAIAEVFRAKSSATPSCGR